MFDQIFSIVLGLVIVGAIMIFFIDLRGYKEWLRRRSNDK